MRIHRIALLSIILLESVFGYEPFTGSIVDANATPLFGHVLFSGDGTFVRVIRYTLADGGAPNGVVSQGKYTVTPDGVDPSSGVLELLHDGSRVTLPYHYMGNNWGQFDAMTFDGIKAGFIIYPAQSLLGASNASNRCWVTKDRPAITGFAVSARGPRYVLVRVAGPGLKQFGVKAVVRPSAALHIPGASLDIPSWSSGETEALRAVFQAVGAFSFDSQSNDLARVFLLPPGTYTIVARGDGEDAELLTEVYFLPQGSATNG